MLDNLPILIELLIIEDDPNIIAHISDELVKKGSSIIPKLQTAADSSSGVAVEENIDNIIHRIRCQELRSELAHWATYRNEDLLEGLMLVASFQYQEPATNRVIDRFTELRRCATDDVSPTCATTKSISILSNNIYGRFEYKVANERDCSHDVRLYYISDMLGRRKASPTLMAAVYYLCSTYLNIPTWFIDAPDAMTLAFGQRTVRKKTESSYKSSRSNGIKIDCLLNINKGTIEAMKTFQTQLEDMGVQDISDYIIPVDNKRVIQRLFEELAQVYHKSKNQLKYNELMRLAHILD